MYNGFQTNTYTHSKDTFFELAMIENPIFAFGIQRMSVTYSRLWRSCRYLRLSIWMSL